MDKNRVQKLRDLSFEDALKELEERVSRMESGNLPLEDMMKNFEEGRVLAAVCEEKLKAVEKKIEILRKKADGGEWELFEETPADRTASPAPSPKSPPAAPDADQDLLF